MHRQVRGSHHPLAVLQGRDDVRLLVDVIAQRDHIHAIRSQLVEQVLRDAASAGDVLGVGDDQVDLSVADEGGELLVNDLPAGPADDIPQAQDPNRHLTGL